jgi:hypothetical protein
MPYEEHVVESVSDVLCKSVLPLTFPQHSVPNYGSDLSPCSSKELVSSTYVHTK